LRVRIEASDCGNTVRHSTQAWLILHVEDVNDNAPTIHINYIVDANDQTGNFPGPLREKLGQKWTFYF